MMQDFDVIWDMDDEPKGNARHIAEHGITAEDVEDVLYGRGLAVDERSDASGLPMTFGYTASGLFIAVVWCEACDDPRLIYPVTAFEVDPRARRS